MSDAGTRELTLLIDGEEVVVTVHREGDRIVVERDGERHEVVVRADRPVLDTAAAAGGTGPARRVRGGDVRAPMVGVVREIHTAVGKTVSAGDRLITMEAMKMDIYVNAPVDGEVTAVTCAVGETATEGAVLATVSPTGGSPDAGATGGGDVPAAGDASGDEDTAS
ncbi:MAG: acetyl-CoA carboxylase biotin carboxyl carrier protein subunit [Spirochaetota bacterium]